MAASDLLATLALCWAPCLGPASCAGLVRSGVGAQAALTAPATPATRWRPSLSLLSGQRRLSLLRCTHREKSWIPISPDAPPPGSAASLPGRLLTWKPLGSYAASLLTGSRLCVPKMASPACVSTLRALLTEAAALASPQKRSPCAFPRSQGPAAAPSSGAQPERHCVTSGTRP